MSCICAGIGIAMNQIREFSEYERWITGKKTVDTDLTNITIGELKHSIECAFTEAFLDAGIAVEQLQRDERIGLVIGSSLGFIDQIDKSEGDMDFSWLVKKFRFKGPVYVVSNTCASSLTAVNTAQSLLKTNELDTCIVGGIDIAGGFITQGFRSMELLSQKDHIELRNSEHLGTVLSPAVAFVVLNHQEKPTKYNVEVVSSAVSNEAYDLVRLEKDADTLQKTIRECLVQAKVSVNQVDAILTCANGIKAVDLQQDYLVGRCFQKSCTVGSIKTITGHTLGASTLLDMISSIVFMRAGKILTKDGEWLVKNISCILAVSVGFVGVEGVVLLKLRR